MVEAQKPADIEQLKKELADIKREVARKELEDIKREKMREELEELKAARLAPRQYTAPKLSIVTAIMAVLALLVAGYMLGTLYWLNMAAEIDKYLSGYGLPISGPVLLTVMAVVLALIGCGLVAVARK